MAICQCLEDDSGEVRSAGIDALRPGGKGMEPAITAIVARSQHPDRDVREAAVRAPAVVADVTDARVTQALAKRFEDVDAGVWQAAVRSWCVVGCDEVAACVGLLDDPDANVRGTALAALSEVVTDDYLRVLLTSRLESPSQDVRITALQRLGRHIASGDSAAISGVSALLQDEERDVREAAVRVLVFSEVELSPCLEGLDPDVRRVSAEALEQVRDMSICVSADTETGSAPDAGDTFSSIIDKMSTFFSRVIGIV